MADSLHILLGTSAHVCSGYVTQVSEPWPVGLLFFYLSCFLKKKKKKKIRSLNTGLKVFAKYLYK